MAVGQCACVIHTCSEHPPHSTQHTHLTAPNTPASQHPTHPPHSTQHTHLTAPNAPTSQYPTHPPHSTPCTHLTAPRAPTSQHPAHPPHSTPPHSTPRTIHNFISCATNQFVAPLIRTGGAYPQHALVSATHTHWHTHTHTLTYTSCPQHANTQPAAHTHTYIYIYIYWISCFLLTFYIKITPSYTAYKKQ